MKLSQYAMLGEAALEEMHDDCTVWLDCPNTQASIPVAFVSAVVQGDETSYDVWVYDSRDNEVLWGRFPADLELRIESD